MTYVFDNWFAQRAIRINIHQIPNIYEFFVDILKTAFVWLRVKIWRQASLVRPISENRYIHVSPFCKFVVNFFYA